MPLSGFSRLVRATPEVYALHTHWYKEQITGIYRMDWRDELWARDHDDSTLTN
jgi:hypothetical protein